MAQTDGMWVSVTGLTVRRTVDVPVFWFHAVRCMVEARQSPGNLGADTRTIDNVHYTVSLWADPADMRAFVHSDVHVKAMTVFPRIAAGKVLSGLMPTVPDWTDVPALLARSGREV
jgi:hypothetical protein